MGLRDEPNFHLYSEGLKKHEEKRQSSFTRCLSQADEERTLPLVPLSAIPEEGSRRDTIDISGITQFYSPAFVVRNRLRYVCMGGRGEALVLPSPAAWCSPNGSALTERSCRPWMAPPGKAVLSSNRGSFFLFCLFKMLELITFM